MSVSSMAAGIAIRVGLTNDSTKMLYQIARAFPSRFRSDFMGVCVMYRNVFSAIMKRSGDPKYGVPKFARQADLTTAIKARDNINQVVFDGSQKRFATDGRYHQWWPKGSDVYIGFPDLEGLSECMGKWMDSQKGEIGTETRHAMHRHLGRGVDVPKMYDRPQRHVIEPFAEYLAGGAFAEEIVRRFQKWFGKRYGREFVASRFSTASYSDVQLALGSGRTAEQMSKRSARTNRRHSNNSEAAARANRGYSSW